MEQLIQYGWMVLKALGIIALVCLVVGFFTICFLEWFVNRKNFPVLDGSDEDDILKW